MNRRQQSTIHGTAQKQIPGWYPVVEKRMRHHWGLWASCAFLIPVGASSAADASRDNALQCPGVIAWREAHRDQLFPAMSQRDQTRTFSAPELRAELQRRFELDQSERRQLIADPHNRELSNKVQRLDKDNLTWLKNLMESSGVPTVAQVGESGVHWTWLLVQHADDDPQFQASLQPVFAKRQEASELPADDLARLTDRILLAAGKPQRFGTQFDWYSGQFKPTGVENFSAIDVNRRALGLMPLADYACMMNGRLKHD